MTIEHRRREVTQEMKTLAIGGFANMVLGREGSIVIIEPLADQVLVFRFGPRGTNGPRETKYQQSIHFLGAVPKDDEVVKGFPQGYSVSNEEINNDPICQKRGIIWKAS
jgi:hypothetical protein